MEKIGYVYLTTNLVNGKQYVGQHLHNGFDKSYKGSGNAIKAAFNKYGWDNFDCKVICWCSTQTQLNEAEDNYIKLLDTMSPNGYNLRGGGSKGRYSKEARKNMSEGTKKYYESEEGKNVRNIISEASKKCWENEEYRKKQSEAHKGKKVSEKTRKIMSEGQKNRYQNPEEHKKLSEARKGKTKSEETRKKMSEARKKYYTNEENRKKASEAKKKYWENEEYRKKQSEAQRNNPKKSKKVFQYTLNKVLLKEWASLKEIERVLGFNISSISFCCNGKYKSAYDFIWRYADNNQQETSLQIPQ